jgi:hypothetical protein
MRIKDLGALINYWNLNTCASKIYAHLIIIEILDEIYARAKTWSTEEYLGYRYMYNYMYVHDTWSVAGLEYGRSTSRGTW